MASGRVVTRSNFAAALHLASKAHHDAAPQCRCFRPPLAQVGVTHYASGFDFEWQLHSAQAIEAAQHQHTLSAGLPQRKPIFDAFDDVRLWASGGAEPKQAAAAPVTRAFKGATARFDFRLDAAGGDIGELESLDIPRIVGEAATIAPSASGPFPRA